MAEEPKLVAEPEPKSKSGWLYVSVALIIILTVQTAVFAYITVSLQQSFSELQTQYADVNSAVEGLRNRFDQLQALNVSQPSTGLTPVQLYELAKNSVVLITVEKQTGSGLEPYAEGSGFIYDMDGHIVTNNHVVEGADAIDVTFSDGTVLKAELVGRDPYSDLAVISVNKLPSSLHPLSLGKSSKLLVGESVAAIGNPFGLSNSMSLGIVSQVGRTLDAPGGYVIVDVVQVDAAINPGNSGGPLMNMRGEVVGVNTAIIQGSVGVGFAIPSDTVSREVPQIIQTGQYGHPWLGVSLANIDPDIAAVADLNFTKGVLVVKVIVGGPADSAGIRAGTRTVNVAGRTVTLGGDVIVGVDGVDIRQITDLMVYTERNNAPGDIVVLKIVREGRLLDVPVTLGTRPQP